MTACSGRGSGSNDATAAPAASWLTRYVQPDGRVARPDQGGDTVSEGQSYALTLALATNDTTTFDRVWDWTRTHLQRPDALLAYHADAQGHVLDPTPATDADVVTAWALLRRGGPDTNDGQHLAAAVLSRETTTVAGKLVLAAGPWATGQPATLNPSYWAFPILRQLATLAGDARWNTLADTAAELLSTGSALPADWLRADGPLVRPEPAPDGTHPSPQYGPDAQRVLLWSAYSCQPTDHDIARRAATVLLSTPAATALASDLTGHALQSDTTPLAQLAAAAAAQAAGNPADADRARTAAALTAHTYPSYYGDAWVALDQVSSTLFTTC